MPIMQPTALEAVFNLHSPSSAWYDGLMTIPDIITCANLYSQDLREIPHSELSTRPAIKGTTHGAFRQRTAIGAQAVVHLVRPSNRQHRTSVLIVAFLAFICCGLSNTAAGFDERPLQVEFKTGDRVERVVGRIVTDAADGGILLEARDGQLHSITPDIMVGRQPLEAPFEPLNAKQLGQRLLREFGAGFRIHHTTRYVICSNADARYVEWTGVLLQRLMAGFYRYWKTADLDLAPPEFPLVAIIFARQADYVKYATTDVGPLVAQAQGYYSAKSNRIVTYDLTAAQGPSGSVRELQLRLQRNEANIATIVHEATHQLAFNSGLHVRFADNPNWLTEGMAMFFETPDLRNNSGWRTIGRVNPVRLRRFRQFVETRRQPDSLRAMLTGEAFSGGVDQMTDVYSQAWALNYFLLRKYRKQYVAYLKILQQKSALLRDDPQERLTDFETAFEKSPTELEREFVRYIQRLKAR